MRIYNKRKIKNGILAIKSFCFLLARKLLGNNIKFNSLTLVSNKANLITNGNSLIQIGRLVGIKQNVEISAYNGNIIIGNNCFINNNCMIISHKKIIIGDKTTIGPNTCIYDHDHDGKGGYISKEIIIGNNVWIGAGCIILKGVKIGDNCLIGAGCLLTHNIEDNYIIIQKRNTLKFMKKKVFD